MGDGEGDPGEKKILEMFMTAACKAGGGDSGEVRSGDAAWSGEVRSGEVRSVRHDGGGSCAASSIEEVSGGCHTASHISILQ